MGKKLVRKALEMLRKLSQQANADEEEDDDEDEDEEDPYIKFWEAFGKNIKLGLIEDSSNRTKLSKLLRFKSSASDGKWTSLEEYVERMPAHQDAIYYLAGESVEAVEASPHMAKLRAKGFEVLYMVDPIDEYAVQNLTEFDGKKLQSINKEGLKLGSDADHKAREKLYKENFKPLTNMLKDLYGGKVSKIQIDQDMTDSPALL